MSFTAHTHPIRHVQFIPIATFRWVVRASSLLTRHRPLWRLAYAFVKGQFIRKALADFAITCIFKKGTALPRGYGFGLDERCIEYPWFFAHASQAAENYLDAGSIFNSRPLLRHPYWGKRKLTILTLAPEKACFWRLGVSYQYADLRNLPLRDNWFDEIACLSTLEHVGMDNFIYTRSSSNGEIRIRDFRNALTEIRRVLKPGGRLMLSVPFGEYQNCRAFQQFDAQLLHEAMDAFQPACHEDRFYRYTPDGWQTSTSTECAASRYSDYALGLWAPGIRKQGLASDLASGARAVACCVWQK